MAKTRSVKPASFAVSFGEEVARYRDAKGWSQEGFAEKAGRSVSSVRGIEQHATAGRHHPGDSVRGRPATGHRRPRMRRSVIAAGIKGTHPGLRGAIVTLVLNEWREYG